MNMCMRSKISSATSAGLLALALICGAVAPAPAEATQARGKTKLPDNFGYEIRNGQRVPKANRVVAADGSWREERKDGKCTTVRQRTAAGEYRETRKCD